MPNPLLADWTAEFAIPPFDRIEDEHFAPALEAGMEEGRTAIGKIAENPESPSFANTIEALELADRTLDRVAGVFYNLAGADATPAREALMRDMAPKLSAYGSEITMNAALFARIEELWQTREALDLSEEQARVLYLTRRSFVRSGAALKGAEADRLKEIKSRLATLGTAFTQNLLADEREWYMDLTEEQVAQLPDIVADSLRAAGAERDRPGAVVTLNRSHITPFLANHPDRDLRRRAFEAWISRGANGGETDNREIASEILKLREERAKLLSHDTFADYKLETEMAGTPDAVRDLLMQVWQPARSAALADQEALAQMAREDGLVGPLEPWDWRYYSERRRRELHDLDEGEVKPFFRLDQMIEASFACANRLFGLEFSPIDPPMYHEDVRAWEVTRNGDHVAVFLGDYFARPSKRSGAWCSAMRSQQKLAGDIRPIVVNVCNFAKGDPALLSYDDARTLFHEFGHALHQMLSDVTYPSISGTSVARDFVELPSQLYEHWLEVPEVLSEFATDIDGNPIPDALRDKVLAAATYDMGFQTVEYLASALVDLAFHDGPAPADPMQKQAEVLERIEMPRAIVMRHATPHFAHVFAGDGYSSGYYSYMWSEVMDADAFAAFEEAGDAFDPDIAKRLEADILSRGGSVDAAELYTRFRGRLPGVEALLRGRGLDRAA
ncbi:M3 family metallopeptidase [Jannaschia aquimarina]|uniref:Dcp protein n=1 Tax=Jannaschia aquimarina TaxID=935700 RepID=A0A0D1D8X5_9RHOB|nr:M3 family metallopeptidase [Jannaschia aquimarina]KIT16333.1 Peptidyl-dipeptidase dcp [Jannaschia aquimarina]SNT26032.1 peptidyl-dipeptidase Dcp Metallo peptidase. MEROPS family M03A [Jannaschia aquimarina]